MGLLDFRHRQPTSTTNFNAASPQAATPQAAAHEATHSGGGFWSKLNEVAKRYAYDGQADEPGLPGAPEWYESQAPLPPMKLAGGGMRQITGGGRRSF